MAITAPVGRYNWIKVVDVMTRDPLTVTPVETIGQADDVEDSNGDTIINFWEAQERARGKRMHRGSYTVRD